MRKGPIGLYAAGFIILFIVMILLEVKRDQSYTVTLDKSGQYNVYCQPHPFMKI